MTPSFADTSFYVALVSPRDALHAKAVDLASQYQGPLVTTEYVLIETGNFLSRTGDRSVFVELLRCLQDDAETTILASSHDRFNSGVARYRDRRDKDWSLTDCISMVAMEELGLTDAFTSDHHFEQAGFKACLL